LQRLDDDDDALRGQGDSIAAYGANRLRAFPSARQGQNFEPCGASIRYPADDLGAPSGLGTAPLVGRQLAIAISDLMPTFLQLWARRSPGLQINLGRLRFVLFNAFVRVIPPFSVPLPKP